MTIVATTAFAVGQTVGVVVAAASSRDDGAPREVMLQWQPVGVQQSLDSLPTAQPPRSGSQLIAATGRFAVSRTANSAVKTLNPNFIRKQA